MTNAASSRSHHLGPGGMGREEAAAVLLRAVDVGLDLKYRYRYKAPASERVDTDRIANEPLPRSGRDVSAVLEQIRREYLPHFVNMSTPTFAGFPDAGNHIGAMAGAVLGEIINSNLINATISGPGATEMELAVVRWFRMLIGFEDQGGSLKHSYDGGGIPTQGGTAANFAALLLALARKYPDKKRLGLQGARPRVLVPESIGHYTVGASATWAGLGSDAIVAAPISGYRYDLDALGACLEQLVADGVELAMAVAYAGDSRTMTIEYLDRFADVVRTHYPEAWLHCDGCHGTSLLFSERERHRLSGMELFDSVAVDPHKVLSVPFNCSYLLVRKPAELQSIATEAELILTQAKSMGQITPVSGSRAFHSLRVWMLMKTLGVEGIGALVEQRIDGAKEFAALVDETESLQRMNNVDFNSVAFTIVPRGASVPLSPDDAIASAQLTRRAHRDMIDDGMFYLHSFELPDSLGKLGLPRGTRHPVLRYMSGNPLMNGAVQRELIEYVKRFAGD